MVDITFKSSTHRKAIAEAILSVSSPDTIRMIVEKKVPKGDVFEMAKAAGFFGVKKTADMIPDCHPLPIEYCKIDYRIENLNIIITLEVHTLYKTGVEVEAMHGATIVALTMYDMLKPVDKGIEINRVRLLKKEGGKSDLKKSYPVGLKARVIVCSDSISAGIKEDKAGKAIIEKLCQYQVDVTEYQIIPDEIDQIQKITRESVAAKSDLLIFTGGTGLSARDVTPEALEPLLERKIPGIMETVRSYGQQRTPYSMLSRGVSGTIGKTLILALPGSTRGASESMDALLPGVLHLFNIMGGARHD